MATKEPKLELFPITEKGATTYIPKTKYLSSRAAQLSKKPDKGGLGVEIPVDTVKALLGIVLKKEELATDASDEHVKAFELITADTESAKEHLEELTAVEEEKSKTEAAEQEKKRTYEASLILASKDAKVISNFNDVFDTTNRNRCVAKDGVTDEQLVGGLAYGFSLQSYSQWVIGDIVVALEDRGHDNVVIQLCADFKQSYSTISNAARVCRAVKPEERDNYTLPFSTIREIVLANYEDDEKKNIVARKKLLDKAQKGGFDQKEARAAVRIAQGKEESLDAPKSPRYLVGVIANLSTSTFNSEKPKFSEDTFVVDIKTQKYLDLQVIPSEKEGEESTKEEVWKDFGAETPAAQDDTE